jgi:putative ABC transport system permease protein
MSLWSRITNIFRRDNLSREIDEELQSHLADAIEHGRDPAEARRAFGSPLRHRDHSHDVRLIPWLDSLRADAIFGWRQLLKRKVASAAAILSLGLGIGACVSAFRLIDALLLRPLPIATPQRLYSLYRNEINWDGQPQTFDGWAYPAFSLMRAAARGQAELIAVSYAERTDLTYRSDDEMEKAHIQYVSGWMFRTFGIQPARGRLFTENDDLEPGAHPYAVLSHDYWTRRFGKDPNIVGRTFHLGSHVFQIIGVAQQDFAGTEPGTIVDIFIPAMMNGRVSRADSTWHRTLAVLSPGVAIEPLRERLNSISLAFETERSKGFTESAQSIANYLRQTVMMEPAPSGISDMQQSNRRSLAALGVLVALVLLIACANVANLMTAQASARAREMALRVSIGAGRLRLVQLVLVESAMLAFFAAAVGAFFAWTSAPYVVGMINPPDDPARLFLPVDGRVLGFGLALTIAVTFLFGLTPALRASSVAPVSALKGGDDPHSRRRLMHALIAVQVSFCFLVLFVAGLFVETFNHLATEPTGFSSDRLLNLETEAAHPQPPALWDQTAEHLRAVPGVQEVALSSRTMLGGDSSNDEVCIDGGPPSNDVTYFMKVSPGWFNVMKIPLAQGRDFLPNDTYPGSAIVSETFAKHYYPGRNPLGRTFEQAGDEHQRFRLRIVGIVPDARYRDLRDQNPPVAYVPFRSFDNQPVPFATFIVHTSAPNPLAFAQVLRKEVKRAQPEFRVSNVRSQVEVNQSLTVRERLLATLAMFFAAAALLLAGIGLYGVLDYSVLQRRREFGIRLAIGAQPGHIARGVTADVFSMVVIGAAAGLTLGMVSARYLETLLYQVKPTDSGILALPSAAILAAALLAALPAVIRAIRIDPVTMLRAE